MEIFGNVSFWKGIRCRLVLWFCDGTFTNFGLFSMFWRVVHGVASFGGFRLIILADMELIEQYSRSY